MAKTKVSEFDAVASNNTDINSVNVAEGCPPSGINNAIREMASLLKKQEVGTDAMTSPDINGGTIDGATIGGSSGVTIGVSDGTVSAPSIKFTSDTNTGIYRGGTDILKFVTAGTDAITINASQQTTFAGNIDVTGTVTSDGLTVEGSSSGTLNNVNFLNTNSGATTTATRIGIGVSNSAGASYTYIEANEGGVDAYPHLNFYTGSSATKRLEIEDNGDISFYEDTGTTPKLFWDASEESLGIGTTTALITGTAKLSVNGQIEATTVSTPVIDIARSDATGTIINLRSVGGAIVGAIGTVSGGLSLGSGDTGLYFEPVSNEIRPFNTTTNASIDNVINIGNSTKRFKDLYLSGGVYVGGTGSANYLDDYEKGTWVANATATGVTLTASSGVYTKVGNIVYVSAIIGFPTTSSTDNATIDGFPFTCANGNQFRGGFAFGFNNKGDNDFTFLMSGNTQAASFHTLSGGVMQTSSFSAKTFIFQGVYQVA